MVGMATVAAVGAFAKSTTCVALIVAAVVAVPPLVVVCNVMVRLLPVPETMVMFPAPPVTVQAPVPLMFPPKVED